MNAITIKDATGNIICSVESSPVIDSPIATKIGCFSVENFAKDMNDGNTAINITYAACITAMENASPLFSKEGFGDTMKSVGQTVVEALKKAWESIKSFFINLGKHIKDFIQDRTLSIMSKKVIEAYNKNGLRDDWKTKKFKSDADQKTEIDIFTSTFETIIPYFDVLESSLDVGDEAYDKANTDNSAISEINGGIHAFNAMLHDKSEKSINTWNEAADKINSIISGIESKSKESEYCSTVGEYFDNAGTPKEWITDMQSGKLVNTMRALGNMAMISVKIADKALASLDKKGTPNNDYHRAKLNLSRACAKIANIMTKSYISLNKNTIKAAMIAVTP